MSSFAGATVAFRVDASLQIGTGHVMRCLTLAAALRDAGARCSFVSRARHGHLAALVERRGFAVALLPRSDDDWPRDAEHTVEALGRSLYAWVVVDHYGLDARWEAAVGAVASQVLVIDDLADRPHRCDLLLDQNLGRQTADYSRLVPPDCPVLAGAAYAILRPEFAQGRAASLRRRKAPVLKRLLIALGGVDLDNVTGSVLQALRQCALPRELAIDVVLGSEAPWRDEVRRLAAQMQVPTHVRVGIDDMAAAMTDADLAIGAAGSSAWERCCLGLPTLMFVLAGNQREAAAQLEAAGAAIRLEVGDALAGRLGELLSDFANGTRLAAMGRAAGGLTDGAGVGRVLDGMRRNGALRAEAGR